MVEINLTNLLVKGLSNEEAEKWEVATHALTSLVSLYSQVIKEEFGLEAYYRVSTTVWNEFGKSLKKLSKQLKIDCKNASSVHFGLRNISRLIMGAELDFEVIEALKDRSVIRIYGCPWHKIMLKTGVQSFCEPHHEIHEAFCQSFVNVINPNLTFRFTKHSSTNESSYCEEIIEYKATGIVPQ